MKRVKLEKYAAAGLNRYKITSNHGANLGVYAAKSAGGALEAMARHVGYKSFADLRRAHKMKEDCWTTSPSEIKIKGFVYLVREL